MKLGEFSIKRSTLQALLYAAVISYVTGAFKGQIKDMPVTGQQPAVPKNWNIWPVVSLDIPQLLDTLHQYYCFALARIRLKLHHINKSDDRASSKNSQWVLEEQ